MFMMAVAVVFSFGVAYIAHRGVNGSTAVSVAINVIQISALLVFAVIAIGYRLNHPPGSVAYQFDSVSGEAYTYEFATTQTTANGQTTETIVRDANMVPQSKIGADGKPVPYQISYPMADDKGNFLSHPNARSVVGIHNFGWMFVQATVAILILVGFESVTAMGGEAKNAKRDVPIAVITSLLVQGAFCYLIEYFAGASHRARFLRSRSTIRYLSQEALPSKETYAEKSSRSSSVGQAGRSQSCRSKIRRPARRLAAFLDTRRGFERGLVRGGHWLRRIEHTRISIDP
jgi:hypothetical protein